MISDKVLSFKNSEENTHYFSVIFKILKEIEDKIAEFNSKNNLNDEDKTFINQISFQFDYQSIKNKLQYEIKNNSEWIDLSPEESELLRKCSYKVYYILIKNESEEFDLFKKIHTDLFR